MEAHPHLRMRSKHTAKNYLKCYQIAKISTPLYEIYDDDKDGRIRFRTRSRNTAISAQAQQKMVKIQCNVSRFIKISLYFRKS